MEDEPELKGGNSLIPNICRKDAQVKIDVQEKTDATEIFIITGTPLCTVPLVHLKAGRAFHIKPDRYQSMNSPPILLLPFQIAA